MLRWAEELEVLRGKGWQEGTLPPVSAPPEDVFVRCPMFS